MLIQIHMIQNHSPANLNRDDLGAPKTCYFGGVLRSRISSQCLKRSIRTSAEFQDLLGGIRTRQLPKVIARAVKGDPFDATIEPAAEDIDRAQAVLKECGFEAKKDDDKSKMLVYASKQAIREMAAAMKHETDSSKLARQFCELIARQTAVPDMALSGRMLQTGSDTWKGLNTSVEAALQVAHAISTHEARPEVDYYVAKDDVPGEDAGAGYVDEAMFSSACFYKYFSINWNTLVNNLGGQAELAAHTVGAFIRGAALINPAGKQNGFASHCHPDGVLVETRAAPLSYANAFAAPVTHDTRDMITQSVAQLAQYVRDTDVGYGRPSAGDRFWFSPNLRYNLTATDGTREVPVSTNNLKSLEELVFAVVKAVGYDWDTVRQIGVH
jgi:CRISPR system Cascade subunit CasC